MKYPKNSGVQALFAITSLTIMVRITIDIEFWLDSNLCSEPVVVNSLWPIIM